MKMIKRGLAVLFALAFCLMLCACGEPSEEKLRLNNVISLINEIGEVTVDSGEAIDAAEEAYEALTVEEQEKIKKNADALVAARKEYDECAKVAKCNEVVQIIDAIGEVTLDSDDAIAAAEKALHTLSALEQKEIPEASKKLRDARNTYNKLFNDWIKTRNTVIIPAALQGVWCSPQSQGGSILLSFRDDCIETYALNPGKGASLFFAGTFTVENGKINYDFEVSDTAGATGYSWFTYENEKLILTTADGNEIKRVSSAELMEYLTEEEACGNHRGVVCLAELILNNFPDLAEADAVLEKKDAAAAAIKAEGENALKNMRTTYDKIQKVTWYEHKNQPKYVDSCCYIYPYFGRMDNGSTWLRVKLNYTDAKTDAGWIFFHTVTFSVDGENTTKYFSLGEITRDNDTEVWEIADFEPSLSEMDLLRDIASSNETIIRFEGDKYYYDHTVTDKEKNAITDVLTAYNYISENAE